MRRLAGMESVANRPIAEHVLDALASAGITEVLLILPAASRPRVQAAIEHNQRLPSGLQFLEQSGAVDFGSALELAVPLVGNRPAVVHLGDGLLGEPLIASADPPQDGDPDLTLLVYQGADAANRLSPVTRRLLRIAELDGRQTALGVAGVCKFGPGALRLITLAGAHGVPVDPASAAARIVEAGGRVGVRLVDRWRRCSGDPADLLDLNRIALDGLDASFNQAHQNGNRIEGRVLIDETASVRSSVVCGPSVIGPGAQIADAYIGPYTAIGRNVRIEGAEIEQSIISDGASVMHVGGRLLTSVVGRDARIFRDFSLPRALRLCVGDGNQVALC